MLDEYLPGSREWLYEDVAEWLDHALAAAVKDDKPLMDSGPSRMYVLLGDAGMVGLCASNVVGEAASCLVAHLCRTAPPLTLVW